MFFRRFFRLPLLLLAATPLWATAACGEKKRTEIVLGIATDLNAPRPLASVRLELFRHPEGLLLAQQELMVSGNITEPHELPGSYAVYSAKGTPDRFRVVLNGIDDTGKKTVTRTAVLTLVPQKTLFLRLGVVTACVGRNDCAAGDTCIEGRCAPEEVDTSRLPEYQPGMERTAACAGETTFINTSTMLPIPVATSADGGVACNGLCREGMCLPRVLGTFTPTNGPMSVARVAGPQMGGQMGGQLVTLPDSTLLLMGGLNADRSAALASAEIYDAAAGTFSVKGSMGVARAYFAQAQLPDGRVVVMGGINDGGQALASAELYDPRTGLFAPAAGPMTVSRAGAAAVGLADGRVLLVGGTNAIQSFVAGEIQYAGALASAEIFDPTTLTFSALPGRLVEGRAFPHIFRLPGPNGGAVVLCGSARATSPVGTIERFDSAGNLFAAAPLATLPAGLGCSAANLGGGKILVLSANSPASWLFDAATATFLEAGVQPTPPAQFAAVLPEGDVLFAGGAAGMNAYLFERASRSFAYVAAQLKVARAGYSSALLGSGDVLIAGGDASGTAEVFHRPGTISGGTGGLDGGAPDGRVDGGAGGAGGAAGRGGTGGGGGGVGGAANPGQLGPGLQGELAYDEFGGAVALSADGKRVVVGAALNDGTGTNAGHARVFERSGDGWIQLGSDLDGEAAEDRFGTRVAISATGSRVAVGSYLNDGGGGSSGSVRVFDFAGGVWTQVGADIDGGPGDGAGWSVALSAMGHRLVVGGPGVGSISGDVRIYELSANGWSQLGATITQSYEFGAAVGMSSSGDRIAVGQSSAAGTTRPGFVYAYQWDGAAWTMVGAAIAGEALGDTFGEALSLSADGTMVAVGATGNVGQGLTGGGAGGGHVRVYRLQANVWTQVGSDLDGLPGDAFGTSVSLSADGTRLLAGGPSGSVARYYTLVAATNTWLQSATPNFGSAARAGQAVAISADGRTAAVGAVYFRGTAGAATGLVTLHDLP